VLAATVVAAAEPALAQSLLQRLFGFGGSRTQEYRDRHMEANPYEANRNGDASYGYDSYSYDDDWREDTRTYRTLCVRLCDGFYFPIGDSVRRERLYTDNRTCMRRCDGEARLFYYPTDGGSPETMIDLAGRSYATLPNAFRYRKTLVAGCSCKPEPWSPQEAARHAGYAAGVTASVEEDDSSRRRERTAHAGTSVDESYYFEPPRPYARPPAQSRWWRTPWAQERFGWRD